MSEYTVKSEDEIKMNDKTQSVQIEMLNKKEPGLSQVELDGESYFQIDQLTEMRPFLMSIVSASNHWMFVSSNGGLSAGRTDSEHAIFPYTTDDKIISSSETTGPKTIIRVVDGDQLVVWEPFSIRQDPKLIARSLLKSYCGNKLRFVEYHHSLEMTFSYEWKSSDQYGFIRESQLENHGSDSRKVEILDGVQNLMPANVSSRLQTFYSNLVDAYKRSELDEDSKLAMYALSAQIVDRAEPAESLLANVAWSTGLSEAKILLSSQQLDDFRFQGLVQQETDIKAEKPAYFLVSELYLAPGSIESWRIILDVAKDHRKVEDLIEQIATEMSVDKSLSEDIVRGDENLIQLLAASDAFQATNQPSHDARHLSNVLFNIMRGGIFDQNYKIEKKDFLTFVKMSNRQVYQANQSVLDAMPAFSDKGELIEHISRLEDIHLMRLAKEYMPLKFSRRHGDPSRPWNIFNINLVDEHGGKILDYQGNWRDIFQNWEALAWSYPHFCESMIFKFFNLTTYDGYNPYRVLKNGFDWEEIEPDDPWSYIGYWGDHQIIYLLKLLEFSASLGDNNIMRRLDEEIFVYAQVPYQIKSFSDICRDPQDTIEFDHELNEKLRAGMKKHGSDAALVRCDGEIYRVNLTEKLLSLLLAKMANFIPEGGIWMNTQRPEWNDANNALVGNGVSMVTLYYLRRFVSFWSSQIESLSVNEVAVSAQMHDQWSAMNDALHRHKALLRSSISDEDRWSLMSTLGEAASKFRSEYYERGVGSKKKQISISDLRSFLRVSQDFLDHSIRANRRPDGLYESYNLISLQGDKASVDHLDLMLEGQVAAISSGTIKGEELAALLKAMKASTIYRQDQRSYVLYPNKDLDGFRKKNDIKTSSKDERDKLQKISQEMQNILVQGKAGKLHFHHSLSNAARLMDALDGSYVTLDSDSRQLLLRLYEETFNHKEFTGRSGTFFAYEGLGSIYWHMVSKLRLAVLKNIRSFQAQGASPSLISELVELYEEIVDGIGAQKSPQEYGAFPTDPYSHTPANRGAQQPGMTGQVKEDIVARFGELGISMNDGCLIFEPSILLREDFFTEAGRFHYINLAGNPVDIEVNSGELGFTICQVPILYHQGEEDKIKVMTTAGNAEELKGSRLSPKWSEIVISRTGEIEKIVVHFKNSRLNT